MVRATWREEPGSGSGGVALGPRHDADFDRANREWRAVDRIHYRFGAQPCRRDLTPSG